MTHRLIIPEQTYGAIRNMRYTDEERAAYYLSREIDGTVPLVLMPVARPSSGLTVSDDRQFLDALCGYLDADPGHSAVLVHHHPITGPSRPDAEIMAERFRANNRLNRYGIFVGPNGPSFYETDGRTIFPIRSEINTISESSAIASLRQRTLAEFERILRSILGR